MKRETDFLFQVHKIKQIYVKHFYNFPKIRSLYPTTDNFFSSTQQESSRYHTCEQKLIKLEVSIQTFFFLFHELIKLKHGCHVLKKKKETNSFELNSNAGTESDDWKNGEKKTQSDNLGFFFTTCSLCW